MLDKEQKEIIKILIEAKGDPFSKNLDKETCLELAIRKIARGTKSANSVITMFRESCESRIPKSIELRGSLTPKDISVHEWCGSKLVPCPS